MASVPSPAPRAYAALPLGWAALLLYLTLAPAERLPPQPQWELLSFDTFAHAAFFAVQAALAWFSVRRQRRWPWLAQPAGWVVLLGCIIFGSIIEGLQMALPFNRHGEWSDLISDSLGAAVALGLCYWAVPALRRRGWALGLLLVMSFSAAQAQDMGRVRKTIATLASRPMHGRGYVEQGDQIAAKYLRGRLKQLSLVPLAPNYMQSFTLDVNTFPGQLRLENNAYIGKKPGGALRLGKDYIVAPNSGGGKAFWGIVKPLDSLVFSEPDTAAAWQRRKINTALLLSAREQARLQELPGPLRQKLDSLAWLVLVPRLVASVTHEQAVQPRFEILRSSWPGKPVAHWQVDARLQRNYSTQNLAAIIRGTAQPDSFLVVSAHYDHLGMMGKQVYFPGANDNASGVAMLLELAAHYAKPENRPACSVVFLLFGAEEAGLVGSQYFVAHPLVPLPTIKFLVNLDLLGTGEQGATVVNGRLHEAAFRRLTAINEARHYLPALGARGKAANSDHFPFSEAGVPAFFLYTRGGSPAYHDVNDQPAVLSLAGFSGAFGLVRDFLNELGAHTATAATR
jgi:VanZ family protein